MTLMTSKSMTRYKGNYKEIISTSISKIAAVNNK